MLTSVVNGMRVVQDWIEEKLPPPEQMVFVKTGAKVVAVSTLVFICNTAVIVSETIPRDYLMRAVSDGSMMGIFLGCSSFLIGSCRGELLEFLEPLKPMRSLCQSRSRG